MPKFYLIRHGESEGNVCKNAYNSTPDSKIKLTIKGHQQAMDLGADLKDVINPKSDFFFASTHHRAQDTAKNFLEGACLTKDDVQIINEPRICEQSWRNRLDEPFDEKQLVSRRKFGAFHYKFKQGGESGLDVYNRVAPFLANVIDHAQKYGNENIFLFSHGITINVMVMYLLNMTPEEFENLEYINNCEYILIDNFETKTPLLKRDERATRIDAKRKENFIDYPV